MKTQYVYGKFNKLLESATIKNKLTNEKSKN